MSKVNLPHTTVIALSDFEDEELLAIKPTRTRGEYCWTCTPSTILYCIKKFGLDNCTYIDSDIYFYDDPGHLIREMGDKEILLTLHRYTPRYDETHISGKFCVQFMTFKNKPESLAALNWWRNACIDWCYNRVEDGKFGDQKYLDDWETRFNNVHVLQNPAGGVAPWNVQQYGVETKGEEAFVTLEEKKHRLNFYHFHGLRFLSDNKLSLCEYSLPARAVELLYVPYIELYLQNYAKLKQLDNNLDVWLPAANNLETFKKNTLNFLKGKYNIYRINKFVKAWPK
ncbi:glycosyl transferase [Pontibacter korlensis]|uniref:glycosyl transferase n=1 Tax=Pontibacter korlensis TaxID=400092 RepID=UPI0011DD1AFF|nr:glycosyl transferase [Pontibacter korlensis]